ncbi:GDSL-like Lipase/Acylhydrolase [Gemmata sp. SH-PL17]|uniref:SGNH/GDSL hydrolase family protein n=1 Tax=Gemmata sp. SH-PL17 TaxID=1630693 RepID=UPI00078D2E88|nr:SGNH/GDSL hydrolase family protein [Gemmata sp. SH-PL17]AMV25065.1 GDSL-like Lipase/Acylhydrolase [Gemmata sp. SH-PL17]
MHRLPNRPLYPLACFFWLVTISSLAGAEPASLTVVTPKPNQVVQRTGFDPVAAAKEKPGHLAFGFADVALRLEPVSAPERTIWEYSVVQLTGATGRDVPWTKLDVRTESTGPVATARVPAGGWYRLEIRCRQAEVVTHRGAVEPLGVGEVFVVAGQSYATNCNDEKLTVTDPQKRVVAWNAAKSTWGVANDPQPVPDSSTDGSIWPPVGDALVKEFGVPVAFANVAVGATATSQWAPDGVLHRRLVETGKTLGTFRAVLWQQGESDVIAKTTTEKYVANVRAIRHAAATAWGIQPPWLLAKSTHHPTVYTDPEGESRVRKAIDELVARPGFQPGPDTDTLTGKYRGGAGSRRHFSALGQAKAAEMWADVLKKNLLAPHKVEEALADLHLLAPAWTSPIVHRESSVLLQTKDEGPITARLAFPAAEVLEIATADRRHRFDRDAVTLSKDGLTLTFTKSAPVEPIPARTLFVPKGSPQSYAARVGHPNESLMYHPGRWFHDRNVEITYRRRDEKIASDVIVGSLPKTAARLKAGESFTLGISGDSISTGADASVVSNAAPFQPGFAELVTAQLQARFDSRITLKNRAVGGWSVANGVQDLDKLLAEKPNLIVVAYGMNDVGRRDPKWFGDQTRTILDRIRAADKDIEVILVASMLGHGEWTATPRDMFAKYRDALKGMTGPGVALADLTAVWELMLKNKHDLDLTGNGLNHPNDFGHRLYAQAILAVLTERK